VPTHASPTLFLADIGLPMIFITLPLMFAGLIPVVFLETWVARPLLGANYGETFRAVTKANLISTAIGVPLAWLAMLALDLLMWALGGQLLEKVPETPLLNLIGVILFPSWLVSESDSYWTIPVAAIALLIPTFFASWLLEAFFVAKDINVDRPIVRYAMFKANAVSYCFLLLAGCGWLAMSVAIHHS
jgi:hypothetical protein